MYQDFFNKNDDYLNEFKQKVAEQKIATIEEKRAELAHSRNSFLGTIAGIGLACIVGWFVLAPQYQQQNKEIPVIRRPQSAVKIKPDNPGGMEIPNQDKDVYTIVEKKNIDNTVIENLLPTPEQPKLPDIVPEELDLNENAANLDEIVDEVVDEETKTQTEIKEDETANVVINKPADLLSDSPAKVIKDSVDDKQPDVKKEAISVKEAELKPVAKQENNAGWQIQLIASKNKDAIEKTWKTLTEKYSLLKTYSHEMQSSDLGAQGIIYKLRAGSFASKTEAQAACAALKKQGLNDCIAKER